MTRPDRLSGSQLDVLEDRRYKAMVDGDTTRSTTC